MADARWLRVVEIFEAAEQQPTETREAFVRSECGSDQALLEEVSSLLSSHFTPDALQPGQLPPLADVLEARSAQQSAKQAATRPELRPGDQFGPFRIVRTLGIGGMGEVYLARDERLGRQVALKLLGGWLDLDQSVVKRFRKEARAASSLRHPAVPTVFEAGEYDDRHFIVSEYIEGTPLSRRLRNRGPLPWREAVAIAEPLARALAAAHLIGIVHRDVKPGNILIDLEDRPHLVDFGIAKLLASAASGTQLTQLTMVGAQIGTPGYMAPEQSDGEEVGPAADQWSLAAVLHEMVAGKTPEVDHLGVRLAADLPAPLVTLLGRALHASPGARYPGMPAFADALLAVSRQHPTPARGPRAAWLVGGALVVAAGVAAVLHFTGH